MNLTVSTYLDADGIYTSTCEEYPNLIGSGATEQEASLNIHERVESFARIEAERRQERLSSTVPNPFATLRAKLRSAIILGGGLKLSGDSPGRK